MKLSKYFFFIAFFSLFSLNQSKDNIIFTWQMHRHGARAPYLGVKDGIDVYKEKWTQIEELSDVGKRMLYLLGVKVRKRYVDDYHLLSEEYDPQEIYIRSTDVNRTIESIESFLQGLYPNGTGPTIEDKVINNKEIIYPPNKKYKEHFENVTNEYDLNDNKWALPFGMSFLPVHLFYKPLHEFGLYDSNLCLGHKELNAKLKVRKEVIDFGDELLKNFTFLSELENVDKSNKTFIQDYWTIYKYMDGFVCDDTDRRSFDYMRRTYSFDEKKELLKNASDIFLRMDYFGTNYPEGHEEIPIVANSYTMHSLVNWMEKAIEGNENNQKYIKYVIYSAHDSSIGALEHFMKYVFDVTPQYAKFAETRFFELYINSQNEKRVRYLKGDNDIIKDMTFEEFKTVINKRTYNDEKVDEYCKFEKKIDTNKKDDENDAEQTSIIAMILLIIINLILLLILVLILLKH